MSHGAPDVTMTHLDPVRAPGSETIGIAIAIPEPCASEVRNAREAYADPQARGIPTHITLLAPTVVDPTMLEGIDAHLRDAATQVQPFTVSLRGTGTFRPLSPVVFLTVSEGISGCELLERRIRTGPLLRRRNFPYHPHVTLVQEVPEGTMDRAFDEFSEYRFRFLADAFTLYRRDDQSVWQRVRDYPLG